MPAKGKTRTSDRKRAAIAVAKVAGKKTNKQIGAELGMHEKTVAKVSNDIRTTTLILRLKEAHHQEIAGIWANMIKGLAKNMKDHKDPRLFNGTAAVFLRAVTAGDPPLHRVGDQGGSSDGDFTLEEMLLSMRTITKKGA